MVFLVFVRGVEFGSSDNVVFSPSLLFVFIFYLCVLFSLSWFLKNNTVLHSNWIFVQNLFIALEITSNSWRTVVYCPFP